MAVEPLLERHLADEVVDRDLERLLDHAVDLHGPGPGLERPRRRGDALRRAELIEVVVVAGELLRRDRPVERVGLVPLRRIEVEGRIGALGERRAPPEGEPAGDGAAAGEKRAAVDEHRFGRRLRFRDLPPAPPLDPHDRILRDAPEGVATRRHAQVTPWRAPRSASLVRRRTARRTPSRHDPTVAAPAFVPSLAKPAPARSRRPPLRPRPTNGPARPGGAVSFRLSPCAGPAPRRAARAAGPCRHWSWAGSPGTR